MSKSIRTLGLAAMIFVAGGCELVDYYPNHEAPQQANDLKKSGPGTYGGNNSNYPVGTPGTSDNAAPPPGPTLNNSSQGAFSPTGTYSGAATGGGAPTSPAGTPSENATQTGTSAGR